MGILLVQIYFYSLTFQKDKPALKALVYLVLFVDILQTCFSTHAAWSIIVLDWGRITIGSEIPVWTIGTASPLAGSVAFIVQSFFTWRVWVLGEHRRMYRLAAGVISLTALASCIMSFTYGITLERNIFNRQLQTTSLTGWLATCIVCDIFITVTLVTQLRSVTSSEFRSTNHVVHRAIRMAVETGGITSLVAIAELVLYVASIGNIYFFMFIIISGKVYSNSLMASLNSRAPIFSKNDTVDEVAWNGEGFNLERKFGFA